PLLQDVVRLLDLPAAGALEVACEQRLELDQEREFVLARQLLAHEIGPDPQALSQRHGHINCLPRGTSCRRRAGYYCGWSCRRHASMGSSRLGPRRRDTRRAGGAPTSATAPGAASCRRRAG